MKILFDANFYAKVRRTDILITPCVARGMTTMSHLGNSVGVQLLAAFVVLLRSTRGLSRFSDPALRTELSTFDAFGVMPT